MSQATTPLSRRQLLLATGSAVALSTCGGGGSGSAGGGGSSGETPLPPAVNGPPWAGFAGDAQHTAISAIATQTLSRIQWQVAVDQQPEYNKGGSLLSHYGPPVITASNMVIVPVKTTTAGGFRFEGHIGATGTLRWSSTSDYILPAHSWTPSFNLTLTPSNRVYAPGAGGKLWMRLDADSTTATSQSVVFYGQAAYDSNKAALDASVFINTPLTSDAQGNIYFGFIALPSSPLGLRSGIARVTPGGVGIWQAASALAGDGTIDRIAMNCAPAVSRDGQTIYIAVNTAPITGTRQTGYLLALDATTLVLKSKVRPLDPVTGQPAWINDNSTASPTIGPDGEVYFGVLESNSPGHNFRGWMLHYSADLTQTHTPGAFGWDDTASIVPSSMVPSYSGPSSYLLMVKYNNYYGSGSGDGKNRLAILDPGQTQSDPVTGAVMVMKEVLTVLGPTLDPDYYGSVREWCINTAAVDPFKRSVLVNNEDGCLYRWDLSTNTLIQKVQLTNGLGESYTPIAIGADGAVFVINNAMLFSVGT